MAQDAGASDVVLHDAATNDGGAYARTKWSAVYTCTGGSCPAPMSVDTGDVARNAFDGNLQTRWSTGQYQSQLDKMTKFPIFFTIDLGEVLTVSKITMFPGCKDVYDAPGTVEIFLSTQGTSPMDAVFGQAAGPVHTPPVPTKGSCATPAVANAANGEDTITFPQANARFIQIKATRRTTSDRYWAIGELNVYP